MSRQIIELSKKRAAGFRSSHGLNSNEPFLAESFLIKEEIVATFMPLSDAFSGMALKQGEFKGILINSDHTVGRQNFSIAHELFHLYIQENFTSMPSCAGTFDKKDEVEYSADQFAVMLLMPESGVLELIPEKELISTTLELTTIFKISSYFRVSLDATLNRLSNLKLLSRPRRDEIDELKRARQVRDLATMYGGDLTLYEKGRHSHLIGDLAQMSEQLFENEVISEISYLKSLARIGLTPYIKSNE